MLAIASMVMPTEADARRYAAMVVDHATGEVLYSRHPDRWVYPASLTKMMTLYLVFEEIEAGRMKPSTRLDVSRRAAGMPASKLGLTSGSTIQARDAIRALIVKSANDAAVVVAEAIGGGSETRFADLMTQRAHQLGMTSTIFRNASGLPNRAQRTTARDMIQLSRRLMGDFPGYYHLFSKPTFAWNGRTYRSHHRLMARYAGMDGLKTGYIRASGFNLAASVERSGTRLTAVVFGGRTGRSRDAHMAKILDQSFDAVESRLKVVAIPRVRPAFEVLIAEAVAAGDQENDELADTSTVLSTSAETSGGPSSAVPSRIADTVARIDAMTASGPVVGTLRRRPSPLAVAEVPAAGLQNGPEKTGGNGPYGVQVGAYHDPDRARQAALVALRRLPSILLQGDIDVSRLEGRRGTLYRARVVGLELQEAQRACVALKAHRHDCLVVQTRKIDLASASN